MNTMIKHEVLRANLKEWLACKGDRKKRGELAVKLAKSIKMHPKSIGRSMRTIQLKPKHKKKRSGRKITYGKNVDAAIYDIWDAMFCPCGEIMHPSIETYIEAFKEENKWKHANDATKLLSEISLGTLKNRVGKLRRKHCTVKGKSATVSSPLKGMIPIRKSHTWQGLPSGYLQTDTVVHCGDMLTNDVVYSLGAVDFRTYWMEYTAQWNKGREATKDSLQTIRSRFPFVWHEMHPDTGNEFINYHVHEWAVSQGIEMTRSEPYKKNDNMCIEERNGNIARKHLGYARLDKIEMVEVASEILQTACLIHNHFIPVRRMVSKVREGAKWKRTFEKEAKTPYQRVLELKEEEIDKERLRAEHEALNPIALKRKLDMLKKKLSQMIKKNNCHM